MARCGCTGTTCSCKIIGEGGINVRGAGTVTNPYVISGGTALIVNDTASVNLTLLGSGSSTDPYLLTADVELALGALTDVDTSGGTVGDVLALQPDGTYALVPPVTAAVGAVSTGTSLDGDGSSGDPLTVRLDALSGLEIVSGGLRLDPYTVTTEGDLDTTYGALPSGSIVADTDGLNAWLKSDSGWAKLLEDTGTISTVGGNIVAESGWTVHSLSMRRRNGIVQLAVGLSRTSTTSTSFDTGNIANVKAATLVPANMRPIMQSPLRVSSSGPDHAFFINGDGSISVSNYAQPDPAVWAAGEIITVVGTYIGA